MSASTLVGARPVVTLLAVLGRRRWSFRRASLRLAVVLCGVTALGVVHGALEYGFFLLVVPQATDMPPGMGFGAAFTLLACGIATAALARTSDRKPDEVSSLIPVDAPRARLG